MGGKTQTKETKNMSEETTELEDVREMIKYWQIRREAAERMVTSLLQEEKVILQRRLTI